MNLFGAGELFGNQPPSGRRSDPWGRDNITYPLAQSTNQYQNRSYQYQPLTNDYTNRESMSGGGYPDVALYSRSRDYQNDHRSRDHGDVNFDPRVGPNINSPIRSLMNPDIRDISGRDRNFRDSLFQSPTKQSTSESDRSFNIRSPPRGMKRASLSNFSPQQSKRLSSGSSQRSRRSRSNQNSQQKQPGATTNGSLQINKPVAPPSQNLAVQKSIQKSTNPSQQQNKRGPTSNGPNSSPQIRKQSSLVSVTPQKGSLSSSEVTTPRPKLTTAMRRRIARLKRDQGLSYEEAYKQVVEMKEKSLLEEAQKNQVTAKQNGSINTPQKVTPTTAYTITPSISNNVIKASSLPAVSPVTNTPVTAIKSSTSSSTGPQVTPQTTPKTYRTPKIKPVIVHTSVRVGLVPIDYPATKIEQIEPVIEDVKDLMCNESINCNPSFNRKPIIKNGYVIFDCKDDATAKWLSTRELWKTKKWNAVEEVDFPDNIVVQGHFNGAGRDSNETILKLIQSQNAGMSTAQWIVVKRETNRGDTVIWFSIDEFSFLKLKDTNQRLEFGFGQRVRLKRVSNVKKAEADDKAVVDEKDEPMDVEKEADQMDKTEEVSTEVVKQDEEKPKPVEEVAKLTVEREADVSEVLNKSIEEGEITEVEQNETNQTVEKEDEPMIMESIDLTDQY